LNPNGMIAGEPQRHIHDNGGIHRQQKDWRVVARLSVAAGHPVALNNSPGPELRQDLVRECGRLARACAGAQAATSPAPH
jgi:hypothetical protein